MLVSEQGTYKNYTYTIPFELSFEGRRKTLAKYGIVYVGMPKDDFEKAGFTEKIMIDYSMIDNEEYITFFDWYTKDPDDKVTFIIKDDKVRDWVRKK